MQDYEYELLYHHGIKGMKWGVRRTAAQLGHVVSKGGKRVKSAVQASNAKRKARKEEEARERAEEAKRNKPLRKLTDAELKERIDRLSREKQAFDLQRSMASLDQKQISAGKKFANAAVNKVIAPALVDAGKRVLTDYINKKSREALGLDATDSFKELKKTVEGMNLKKQQNELNKYFEREQQKAEKKTDKGDSKKSDDGAKQSKSSEDKKVYTGTVSGKGTSTRKQEQKTSKKPSDYYDPIDTDFVNKDEPVSNVHNSSSYRTGIDYVRRYLLN